MAENVTLGSFATLQNSSIISTLNANNALIETAFADCFSLTGTSPNSMEANLDMNNFQIINLPAPATINSPARMADISAAVSATLTVNYSRLNFNLTSVNFNSANTDNAIAITLPGGFSRWRIANIIVSNASSTLGSATVGAFTATGGGGLAIAALQTTGITTSGANATNTATALSLTNQNTTVYNSTTIYIRVGTAKGSAATADVTVMIDLLT